MTERYNNIQQSNQAKHALAKFIYSKMFDWLVYKINQSMDNNNTLHNNLNTIGILDIFGFEIFKQNSFEQLCINFTNERLQQHFNHHTFKLEEKIYNEEGITFNHIEFIDNQPMLDLITKKPHGVLPLLDEELIIPKGSDQGFLNKLNEYQCSNINFQIVKQNKSSKFIIIHYAGQVSYDIDGFLEKNRDKLTDDLEKLVTLSNCNFLSQQLFNFNNQNKLTTKQKKSSLSKQFQNQLINLMNILNQTQPHYIRCIKPNNTKSDFLFQAQNCYEQLTYSGVFEAVKIRKKGFPFRLSHQEFINRYQCLLSEEQADGTLKANANSLNNPKTIIHQIIKKMKLNQMNIQMGKTRLFYRAEEFRLLELHRGIKVRKQQIIDELNDLVHQIQQLNNQSADDSMIELLYQDLANALKRADQFKIHISQNNVAKTLLEKYVEERMDIKTKNMLQQAIKEKNVSLLEQVLTICDNKGYRTSLTIQAEQLYELILDIKAALSVAIDDVDEQELLLSINMCEQEANLKLDLYQQAKDLLTKINYANQLLTNLNTPQLKNDHNHMKEALAYCDQFNFNSKLVQEIRLLYNEIMKCRSLLITLLNQPNEIDLQSTIAMCQRINYQSELTIKSQHLLTRVKLINQLINKAEKTLHEEYVKIIVYAANEINLNTTNPKLKILKNILMVHIKHF